MTSTATNDIGSEDDEDDVKFNRGNSNSHGSNDNDHSKLKHIDVANCSDLNSNEDAINIENRKSKHAW